MHVQRQDLIYLIIGVKLDHRFIGTVVRVSLVPFVHIIMTGRHHTRLCFLRRVDIPVLVTHHISEFSPKWVAIKSVCRAFHHTARENSRLRFPTLA